MERDALSDLMAWKDNPRRKPMVIRGARQVGKTTLVRLFAEQAGLELAELNFERDQDLAGAFVAKNPHAALKLLEVSFGRALRPGACLLFLDEIQAAPHVLAALRYFYEELPELHILAAGSLLEIALDQPSFPVPVGRIEYLHLGPMRFGEFLLAAGKERLRAFLRAHQPGDEIPALLHAQLDEQLRAFALIGGMPEAVAAFVETGSYRESEAVKHSILSTFHDDFGKYGPKVDPARLRRVFERLPHLVGNKLKYVHVDRDTRAKDLADALHLLTLARVAHRVRRSSANGVPLGAEADERHFKALCLDVGLMTTACGLSATDLERAGDLLMVNRGALAEQLVGQHLLYSGEPWELPQLHYWARQKRGSSAEVDYVLSAGTEILPVEVKAGKTGTLKSLHLFLREKKRRHALRLSSAPPSLLTAQTTLPDGDAIPFQLLSLPLYLAEETRRLAGELTRRGTAGDLSTQPYRESAQDQE